jgi:hypothetical protein
MDFLNANRLMTNLPVVQSYFARRGEPKWQLTIFMQDEHNLVLPGGRGIDRSHPQGIVPSIFGGDEKYLVRVEKQKQYRAADIVLEYCVPNIININTSGKFPPKLLDKTVYCPAVPFAHSRVGDRSIDVLTNIINTNEPRRADLIDRLKAFSGYRNVQGVYDLPGLQALYRSAKIIVNPHQTWHHHSIEEFRVLPALSQGCIVISEDVPLREHIPYHDFVIWCRYEDIPGVVEDTLRDYDRTFDKIHGGDEVPRLLAAMLVEFDCAMDRVLTGRQPTLFERLGDLW